MRKLAFFVEGQTERLFVQALVAACAGVCNVQIVSQRGHLGGKHSRIFFEVEAKNIGSGEDYFVLIVDSGSDEGVVSDIRDRFDGLLRENYETIIGLRDVWPISRNDIAKLQIGMRSSVANLQGVPIEFYLSIMEVEAWFLAENTHFRRINRRLTEAQILGVMGFFPSNQNAESRENPSADLAAIYNIVGILYDKSHQIVERVIDSLNFEDIINVHSGEIENLGGVVNGARNFFRT